jgi:nucleoside-diphosphate-sugar epimerase
VRVALAGGTGFTGRRVAIRLAARGHALSCLVRSTSDRSVLPAQASTSVGDLADPASFTAWLEGADALVFCASMGFGHVPAVVAAADRTSIARSVWVSTTAVFTRIAASSRAVRLAAEESARAGRAAWTILRPTMIYGAPGDRNMERLLRHLATKRVVFVPGRGGALLQPVHVDDLADAIVAALEAPVAERREYDVSGATPVSLDAAIDAAAAALGRRGRKVHLPLRPLASALSVLEALRLPLRVKSEQVRRLAEDKAFSHEPATRDLGFAPRDFATGIAQEARLLGLAPR